MSVTEMIGWDLLFKLIENDLKTESDIVVAIAHWYLIKQAGFRCLGTGDEVIGRCFFFNVNTNTVFVVNFTL